MRATILAGFFVFVAVAGFAQAPADVPDLPSAPAVQTLQADPLLVAKIGGPIQPACSASATCGLSPSISCSHPGGGSCQGINSDCANGVRGSVTCNGVTTQCAACPQCATVCSCGVPCTAGCIVNGIGQTCGDWGICATSCYCGGECLVGGDNTASLGGGACATGAQSDSMLSRIFG